METQYLCLACGDRFEVSPPEEESCPRCGSANTLKLTPPNVFGFLGGGGG
ncbi:MAG: zinc ribbon domain-containing protein [Nitrospirae bacterium]|nr:zinc ribbon domain-containing protein [Nitrospirota bacterium]